MTDLSAFIEKLILGASAVVQDSREVVQDSVFFAIQGASGDGHEHVPTALNKGVRACVVLKGYQPLSNLSESDRQKLVFVENTRAAFAWACCAFYQNPSHSMLMIGVTGTSGKTTTTYIIESILKKAGHRVGVIGTVNFRVDDRIFTSTHTTPGAAELQKLLAEMKDSGCTAVVMEVSSHALKQERTRGVAFDAMVFTNLSREHLDYHPTMEDYFHSKSLLFTEYFTDSKRVGKNPQLVINQDDSYGERLIAALESDATNTWTTSLAAKKHARICVEELVLTISGASGVARERGRVVFQVQTPLVARFNAANALAAASVGHALGLSREAIEAGLLELSGVPGRLERVMDPSGRHIFVDYAHKPDALEKVLKTLQDIRLPGQKIFTVFGCGGDRDRTKRPVMGKLAESLSDFAIVTSDNPRTEDPQRIIEEILRGISDLTRVIILPDRREAIFKAIQIASPGDLVLIAGKGHEDYQILADQTAPGGVRKVHFDDREVALEACLFHKKT